jgi:transposase
LRRHDLSDAEWARLEPPLPAHPRQGHRWNDHRLVIDGIFFRTRTGCPWRDLPERFGNWKTVYNRHRRWSGDGTWEPRKHTSPAPQVCFRLMARSGLTKERTYVGQTMAPWHWKLTTSPSGTSKASLRLE